MSGFEAPGDIITQNWRGKPLASRQTVVNLIAKATTRASLNVKAAIDENHYQMALKITDEQLAGLRLTPAQFHGDWNYLIKPR